MAKELKFQLYSPIPTLSPCSVSSSPFWDSSEDEVTVEQLCHSIMCNQRPLFFSAIRNGTPLNQLSHGWTPLHVACWHRRLEMVQKLLEAGAIPSCVGLYGLTPLHHACQKGQTQIIKILLESGANPNQPDEHGKTPLFLSCERGFMIDANLMFQWNLDNEEGLMLVERQSIQASKELLQLS